MKSSVAVAISEIVINKSKFITELTPITNINDINSILENIKDKYKGATHYCYAYKFENLKKFDDDGEPSGTAGVPILNVLDNLELNNVMCVVTRYFGGIKLGAGGLVRAYTKAVTSTLEEAMIVNLEKGSKITISFTYNNIKQIDYILKDTNIISKSYDEIIEYTFLIKKKHVNDIINSLNDLILNYKIEEDIWV